MQEQGTNRKRTWLWVLVAVVGIGSIGWGGGYLVYERGAKAAAPAVAPAPAGAVEPDRDWLKDYDLMTAKQEELRQKLEEAGVRQLSDEISGMDQRLARQLNQQNPGYTFDRKSRTFVPRAIPQPPAAANPAPPVAAPATPAPPKKGS